MALASARPGSRHGPRSALFALVVAAFGWGVATAATKYALAGLGPFSLIAIALTAATIVLWTVLLLRGYRPPRSWRLVIVLGLLEPGGAYLAETVGLVHTSASNAAVIGGLEPAFVVVLAVVFLRERFTAPLGAALVAGFLGLVVLEGAGWHGGARVGDGLIVLSSLSCAAYTIVVRKYGEPGDALSTTAHQFAVATLVVLPAAALALATGREPPPTEAPASAWVAAVGIGVLGFGASFLLYNWAITYVKASTDAIILHLVPAFTLAAAVLWLRETLTVGQILGASLVAVSVVAYTRFHFVNNRLESDRDSPPQAATPQPLPGGNGHRLSG